MDLDHVSALRAWVDELEEHMGGVLDCTRYPLPSRTGQPVGQQVLRHLEAQGVRLLRNRQFIVGNSGDGLRALHVEERLSRQPVPRTHGVLATERNLPSGISGVRPRPSEAAAGGSVERAASVSIGLFDVFTRPGHPDFGLPSASSVRDLACNASIGIAW